MIAGIKDQVLILVIDAEAAASECIGLIELTIQIVIAIRIDKVQTCTEIGHICTGNTTGARFIGDADAVGQIAGSIIPFSSDDDISLAILTEGIQPVSHRQPIEVANLNGIDAAVFIARINWGRCELDFGEHII